MSDQYLSKQASDGETDYRAGENEGARAPMGGKEGHAEHSVFDGAGNEIVVVTEHDEEGHVQQGTGATSEAATKDAAKHKGEDHLGTGFGAQPYKP